MAIKKLDRLSPYNITDTLARAELYREIKAGDPKWSSIEVQPDEVLRPELTAYRFYQTDVLKWVVLIVAGIDDMREAMESGQKLQLPPKVWVRQRIRHYSGEDVA